MVIVLADLLFDLTHVGEPLVVLQPGASKRTLSEQARLAMGEAARKPRFLGQRGEQASIT